VDALSYMLATVRLRTAVYATFRQRPPWGVRIPESRGAAFHAIVSGQCWFRLKEHGAPSLLGAGDVVVLPRGDAHTFSDDPRSPVRTIDLEAGSARLRALRPPLGVDDPRATTVVCGHMWFDDERANPLVEMLPPVLFFRATEQGDPVAWLAPMLRYVAREIDEDPSAGTDAVLARLSDVIVIQAIRAHVAGLPLDGRGWLHALADRQLGAALALIHAHPDKPWTLAKLASEVGASRSSLAVRFTRVVGEAPLRYLTRWRVQCAQRLLRGTRANVAEIGERVGYRTEAAFSRAFKRWTGVAPSVFRRDALATIEVTRASRGRRARRGTRSRG
jgi:AraC-like DNA-binding protein